MRFIDEAIITVTSGSGGPGMVHFRREKYVPRGGPDGGDGGRGGDIVFIATSGKSTLQDFRYRRKFEAEAGRTGGSSHKSGKSGEPTLIVVPVGTLLKDADTGEQLFDFTEAEQKWVACEGGRGGKGNAHFVTSTHQAPKFSQPGEPGTLRKIKMELKLLADVGIIGFPNAGKSTLISRISAAKPKIADYPFTTLVPNLGVVTFDDLTSIVVADIPGLVEGAHQGAGLGHQFLKHIERTRLFVHLIDGAQLLELATAPEAELSEAIDEFIRFYQIIRNELGLYDKALLHRPEIVVLNKTDILDPTLVERAQKALRKRLASIRQEPPAPGEPLAISAVTGNGVKALLSTIQIQMKSFLEQSFKQLNESDVLLPDGTTVSRGDEQKLEFQKLGPDWSQVTALFGGTFDPPHLGHRQAVEFLLTDLGVKEVVILPAQLPPLKECHASAKDRLEMTRKNFAGLERVTIDTRELERSSTHPSFTFTTLAELQNQNAQIAFVMGSDQLPHFHRWHRFPELFDLCHWVVLERKPDQLSTCLEVLKRWQSSGMVSSDPRSERVWKVGQHGKNTLLVAPSEILEVSSTLVRKKSDHHFGGLREALHPHVWEYLNERRLYGRDVPANDNE